VPPKASTDQPEDYEPVVPIRGARVGLSDRDADEDSFARVASRDRNESGAADFNPRDSDNSDGSGGDDSARPRSSAPSSSAFQILRRGHALTYAGLFLFSFVLFYRPYEFVPLPHNLAFWLAAVALAVYLPTQLATEGNLTARPREVSLVLLLALTALLSVAFAKESRAEGWATFTDIFARAVVMFVVIVNAARTERRLRWLVLLSIGSGLFMSAGALHDYWAGKLTVEGYRVDGQLGGIFGNPNDMALHLVTMLPLAAALAVGSRNLLKKAAYAAGALLLVAGTLVTFSRGGFLAMSASLFVLAWTLRRRNRLAVVACACALFVLFFAVAPGAFSARIFSIFDRSLDAYGSADARQALLLRSVVVAARNPILGVGMGNFPLVSIRNQVTHNAYTQVAAEMGLAALALYALFLWTPLKGLRRITRETFDARRTSRLYYLAAGMHASLVAYMVASFFASVAYYWNVYYLVGYAVCLRRLYEAETAEKGTTEETEAVKAVNTDAAENGSVGTESEVDFDDASTGVRGREPHAARV
jgi:putative inorganic carbon (HCO3(-)) transporter